MKFDHTKDTVSEALGFKSLDEENSTIQALIPRVQSNMDSGEIESTVFTDREKLAIIHKAMAVLPELNVLTQMVPTLPIAIEDYYNHTKELDETEQTKILLGMMLAINEQG